MGEAEEGDVFGPRGLRMPPEAIATREWFKEEIAKGVRTALELVPDATIEGKRARGKAWTAAKGFAKRLAQTRGENLLGVEREEVPVTVPVGTVEEKLLTLLHIGFQEHRDTAQMIFDAHVKAVRRAAKKAEGPLTAE